MQQAEMHAAHRTHNNTWSRISAPMAVTASNQSTCIRIFSLSIWGRFGVYSGGRGAHLREDRAMPGADQPIHFANATLGNERHTCGYISAGSSIAA